MKRISVVSVSIIIIGSLAAFAASCSSSPTTPAADDTHVQFKAALAAANETPAVTNAEATANGTATIDFHLTKDSAGTITAATVDFRVDVAGMPATTGITASHIHPGAAGVAGPVLVTANVSAGEITLTNGAVTYSRLVLPISAANAQAIINNPAGYYFNVHTSLNPAGVMRGQLVKQ